MEQAGRVPNKETRPQAKNKPGPRFVGRYCSARAFGLACPLESGHLSYATTMGKRQIGIFFASLFPPVSLP